MDTTKYVNLKWMDGTLSPAYPHPGVAVSINVSKKTSKKPLMTFTTNCKYTVTSPIPTKKEGPIKNRACGLNRMRFVGADVSGVLVHYIKLCVKHHILYVILPKAIGLRNSQTLKTFHHHFSW